MALIKCSNCGKDISDKSKKCIHCNNLIKSISCPRCKEKIDIDQNKCPICKKILRNKVSVLGKIWIMANAVGLSILALFFLTSIGYNESFLYLIMGLLSIAACVMNCLLFARINSVFYHISNAVNYLIFILFIADNYSITPLAIFLLIYAILYSIVTYLFIKKCLKKKIFSLIYILILSIISIIYIIISYLNPIKNIDFEEKYKDYLKYALGEYKVEKTNYRFIKNFWFHEENNWTITYKDENNMDKQIYLYNYELEDYDNDEEASDYIFASEILSDYMTVLEDKLELGNISNLDDHIYLYQLYSYFDFNNEKYLYHKDILKLIQPETGLNFKDININSLNNDLYYLSMSVMYIPPANNVEEYTKNQVNKLIQHYNIKNAFISCGISYNDNSESYPTYCIKHGQEISCPDSMNNQDSLFIDISNYINLK